jgi:hypothetical protein
MSNVEMSRDYAVDRKRLFDHLVEPSNWPSYYNGMTEVLPYERFAEPGDAVTFRYRLLGRVVEGTATLLDLQPGERFRSRAETRGLPTVEHDWAYEDGDEGTHLRVVMDTPPVESFFGRAIDRFIVPRQIERDLARTLDNVEDLVAVGFE